MGTGQEWREWWHQSARQPTFHASGSPLRSGTPILYNYLHMYVYILIDITPHACMCNRSLYACMRTTCIFDMNSSDTFENSWVNPSINAQRTVQDILMRELLDEWHRTQPCLFKVVYCVGVCRLIYCINTCTYSMKSSSPIYITVSLGGAMCTSEWRRKESPTACIDRPRCPPGSKISWALNW